MTTTSMAQYIRDHGLDFVPVGGVKVKADAKERTMAASNPPGLGPGYKESMQEAMKSFTKLKTYSLPWA